MLIAQLDQRQSNRGRHETKQRQRMFHRNGIALPKTASQSAQRPDAPSAGRKPTARASRPGTYFGRGRGRRSTSPRCSHLPPAPNGPRPQHHLHTAPEIHAQAQSHRPHCIAGRVLPMTRGNSANRATENGRKAQPASVCCITAPQTRSRPRQPAGPPACAAKISLRRA